MVYDINIKKEKPMTQAAQVAKLVRKELKGEYPNTKFSVTSDTYAGGDAVRISYEMDNIDSPLSKNIYTLLAKYQAGHFNSMEDIYEYDSGKGLSVKFVQVQADSSKMEEGYKQDFLKYYELKAFDDQEIMDKLDMWKEQALHKYVFNIVLKPELIK